MVSVEGQVCVTLITYIPDVIARPPQPHLRVISMSCIQVITHT